MLGSIIFIIVIIALIVLTVLFSRNFFKVVAGLWSVLFIIIIILGVFLYFDIKDLHSNFEEGDKVIFLKQNGNIITGFELENNQETHFFRNIDEYNNAFKARNYAKLKGDAYKALIAQKSLFNEVSYVDVINYPIEKEMLITYLNDQEPREKAAQYIAQDNGIPQELVLQEIEKEFSTEDEFKGYLFAKMVGRTLENKDANFIIRAYKDEHIEVYPETITFKLIDFLPQVLFDHLFEA